MLRCGGDPLAGTLWDMYIQLETINVCRLGSTFDFILLTNF